MSSSPRRTGRVVEAREAVAMVMRRYPKFSLARHERRVPFANDEHRAHYIEGLRKAGLPE
jgi:hypothetical protein